MKNQTLKNHIIFFIFFCIISNGNIRCEENLFYVRMEFKTINGILFNSNLIMLPANEEFRIEKFQWIKISGLCETFDINSFSLAEHNAISNLLIQVGLKSVKSNWIYLNGNLNKDEVVMRYEGIIKKPFKIINKGYEKNTKNYRVDMEILFSPVAFPDKWRFLYFKNLIKNKLNDILSIFSN